MSFVTVSGLHKSYGRVRAVVDFSLTIDRGQIYALVGPDGAGKTTVIRALCHLTAADGGSITIAGRDAARQFNEIKPILGYMPQVFSLYPDLTVEENLWFYAGIYGVTGSHYHEKSEYLYRFSNLKPFAGRRAQNLSGGMKQKLALSCALMHDPELLVLDEPTTGVDPLSRRQFWEILLELKRQGVTILVSTPYMDEVARADRAGFVFNGAKLAEGTPEELPKLFEGHLYYLECEPTAALAAALNEIDHLTARRFGGGMHIYIDKGWHHEDLVEPLRRAGVRPGQLKAIKPDLEDCFIQLMEAPQ
ncbi:MAG: ABC transporter ATP-binding protein [Candidatus Zixiibacteriota bacterium]|nr:MAG: ABC transporter ATP-binding protein [candidate division Zixibacteria bacterium]